MNTMKRRAALEFVARRASLLASAPLSIESSEEVALKVDPIDVEVAC